MLPVLCAKYSIFFYTLSTDVIRAALFESLILHHKKNKPEDYCNIPPASTVDIPTGWEPRTKQQPAGLIACPAAQGRAVRILPVAQKESPAHKSVSGILGAMEGTRTPGLLIRRNRMAHFVHFIIWRQNVILIELALFCSCYSIAFFASLAHLCTCYPFLQCAENVQKCAELKSARQNRLFRTAPKAGFQRYLLCKIFQFYPNNNLT